MRHGSGFDKDSWYSSFSLYQDRIFAEIYVKSFGMNVESIDGLIVLKKNLPFIGCMGAFIGGPETYGVCSDWWPKLLDLNCSTVHIQTSVDNIPLRPYCVSPEDNYNIVVDLRPGCDAVFGSFHRTQRQNIRRAAEKGVVVRPTATLDELDMLQHIIYRVSRGESLFDVPARDLLRDLMHSPYGKAFIALRDEIIIGGVFLLLQPPVMYAWISGINGHYRHLHAGALVHFSAMRWGMRQGYAFYDLGDQSLRKNRNLTRFKRHFSPLLKPAYHYHIPRVRLKMIITDFMEFLRRRKG
jgi:hypothetical protein